eukprot:m.240711 g.240711  ORF g.240711 m.240711 type:complete len:323 (+) comp40196_c1_seq30:323-1291(+)
MQGQVHPLFNTMDFNIELMTHFSFAFPSGLPPGINVGDSPPPLQSLQSTPIFSTPSSIPHSSFTPNSPFHNVSSSTSIHSSSPSPASPFLDLSGSDQNGSFLRHRNSSGLARSPGSGNAIKDARSLQKFLEEEDRLEEEYINSLNVSNSQQTSPYWDSSGRSGADLPPLGKYTIATRSPQSPSTKERDDDGHHGSAKTDELWKKVSIDPSCVNQLIWNMRKWLAGTILHRLAEEIEKVNDTLTNIGSGDIQIGKVGLDVLRHIGDLKGQQVPSLRLIIPYLELSTNQEYLVQRTWQTEILLVVFSGILVKMDGQRMESRAAF